MQRNKKRWLLILLGPGLLLTAQATSPAGGEVELDEARLFIEFNATDGDFGLHLFWDGDAWDKMRVEDAAGKAILKIQAGGSLGDQGLTEGFFESDEPSAKELSMEEFFERFPAGGYGFEGTSLEGGDLAGEAQLTHTLPAPPENLWPAEGALVDAGLPLVASFDPVLVDLRGDLLVPALYQVVVEVDDDRFFSVTLPGDAAAPAVTVPPEFLEGGMEYKLEVIAQEEGGNRTISETTFFTR